jgi:hypothetical protein
MLLASAHPEASYPTSSGDNVLSIGTYLHANYKIHILMLSVLYTHLVCMDIAGVFSSEYYILLVACFHSHKLSFIGAILANVFSAHLLLIIIIYFYFKLFSWGIIPKLRVYLVIISEI